MGRGSMEEHEMRRRRSRRNGGEGQYKMDNVRRLDSLNLIGNIRNAGRIERGLKIEMGVCFYCVNMRLVIIYMYI